MEFGNGWAPMLRARLQVYSKNGRMHFGETVRSSANQSCSDFQHKMLAAARCSPL
jgi:hypothetical protein